MRYGQHEARSGTRCAWPRDLLPAVLADNAGLDTCTSRCTHSLQERGCERPKGSSVSRSGLVSPRQSCVAYSVGEHPNYRAAYKSLPKRRPPELLTLHKVEEGESGPGLLCVVLTLTGESEEYSCRRCGRLAESCKAMCE